MPRREIAASAPPATITSASSSMIMRAASPIAWAPVEQAVTTAWFGPLNPYLIEILPDSRLTREPGIKNGLIRRGPFSCKVMAAASDRGQTANAGAGQDAGAPARHFVLGFPAGIRQGLFRGGQTKDDEIIDPPLLFRRHPVVGVKIRRRLAQGNFAGDFDGPGRWCRFS